MLRAFDDDALAGVDAGEEFDFAVGALACADDTVNHMLSAAFIFLTFASLTITLREMAKPDPARLLISTLPTAERWQNTTPWISCRTLLPKR